MAELDIDVEALMKQLNGGNHHDEQPDYSHYDSGRGAKSGHPRQNDRDNSRDDSFRRQGQQSQGSRAQSGSHNLGQSYGGTGQGKRYSGTGQGQKYSGNGQRQRYGNNGQGSKYGNTGRRQDAGNAGGSSYVGAPYNFVPMTKTVHTVKTADLVGHDVLDDDLLSGEIDYTLTAETEIFVGDGTGNFVRDAWQRYAIPGSSIRGLVRTNAQILGFGSVADDIDDYMLMFRDVATTREHKDTDSVYNDTLGAGTTNLHGKSVSVLKNVKAGYITRRQGKYFIYHTVPDQIMKELGEMNYYYLSERTVIESYLNDGASYQYTGLLDKNHSVLAHEYRNKGLPRNEKGKISPFINIGYAKRPNWVDPYYYNDKTGIGGNKGHKDVIRNDYHPGSYPVMYQLAGKREVTGVRTRRAGEKAAPGWKAGYALLSGKMQKKKAIYIIPQMDTRTEPIAIPDEDIRAFQIDFNNKESIIRKDKAFYSLPEEGETRPVFYIFDGKKLYFGYTPHLRLFYQHSIKDGIPEAQRTSRPDYVKALFGFTGMSGDDSGKSVAGADDKSRPGDGSYKSRVSFSDAVITKDSGNVVAAQEKQMILGSPKPSSYNDYLQPQNGRAVTYNSEGFALRGIKQYWLHQQARPTTVDPEHASVGVTLRPLPAGVKFQGRIRFQNLTEEELGLLLWSVCLESGSQMNIGMARSYGYGRISTKIDEIRLFDPSAAYDLSGLQIANVFKIAGTGSSQIPAQYYIHKYKAAVTAFLGGKDVMEDPSVRTFFRMHDSTHMPAESAIRYMDIDAREYQNRRPLPGVDETLQKH